MKNVPYSNTYGSMIYAMIGTRLDIAFGVSLVSNFISRPNKSHWEVVKRMLRYLKGSMDVGLVYKQQEDKRFCLEGYCDSDYAASLDKRRSLIGYTFTFGGNIISWKSNLQHIVALSMTESEYISLIKAIKEAMWLQGIIKELGFVQHEVRVHCDSQSAIHISKNNVFHERNNTLM